MGLLKKIFGTAETADVVAKGAVRGLDALVFSNEERAQMSQKVNEWYLKYLEATQPQNIARRMIAVMVTALWAGLLILSVLLYPLNNDWSRISFTALDEIVNQPFGIIIGFYFLTHAVRTFTKEK